MILSIFTVFLANRVKMSTAHLSKLSTTRLRHMFRAKSFLLDFYSVLGRFFHGGDPKNVGITSWGHHILCTRSKTSMFTGVFARREGSVPLFPAGTSFYTDFYSVFGALVSRLGLLFSIICWSPRHVFGSLAFSSETAQIRMPVFVDIYSVFEQLLRTTDVR